MADDYTPPSGNKVSLDFSQDAYSPPAGNSVHLEFKQSQSGPADDQYLFPPSCEPGGIGSHTAYLQTSVVTPYGIPRPGVGDPEAYLYTRYLSPASIDRSWVGRPSIRNWNMTIYPKGKDASEYGIHDVWNLLQIVNVEGIEHLFDNEPYVQGGVKHVQPIGMLQLLTGKPTVINTTADRTVYPPAIKPGIVGSPNVSPRMIHVIGIYGTAIEGPLVQFPPHPYGWDSLRIGTPEIEYWTRYTEPDGIGPGEPFGYPVVFDPTQKVFPPSVLGTGIFGDIAIKNRSAWVYVSGFDTFSESVWTEVRSNRRSISPAGVDATGAGNAEVRNAIPSLIPDGVDSSRVGVPAVAFRLRYIYGRGYDSLAIGLPGLTQTPSIAPEGFTGEAGQPDVWFRIRSIDASGGDLSLYGDAAIWFRYRYLQPEGTETEAFGTPSIEHGVRELLVSGRLDDKYGRPGISNADLTLYPEGIWEDFASAHMVGGDRSIEPPGFDASRFGSRIIPEIQQVYPLGFSGLYGDATVWNVRQVINPDSVAWEQPAHRWGRASVWNRLQRIVMSYDPDSGLNPPVWTGWTRIENRNKAIRADGHASLKFGYHRIENAAVPLLPDGIAPIEIPDGLMVAMRYRPIHLDGIESPYMAGWHRISNAAAVIHPAGGDMHMPGTDSEVANTRRYYRWVGGYDSSRFGYPMVAFSIRELSIERRYTIEPPPIEMPVVKLHTRYIECAGFEPWGVGLHTATIHWTKIIPRWTLQNLYGYPVVFNVTPELGARGHNSELFGNAAVRLELRPVSPDGGIQTLFGKTSIGDRDRAMEVSGLNAGAFGPGTKVIKTGAPPYSTQFIWLYIPKDETDPDSPAKDGFHYGIAPPEDQVPEEAMINGQYILHESEEESLEFGNAWVRSNVIRVPVGYHNLVAVAEPSISLKTRYLHHASEPRDADGITKDDVEGLMPQEIVKPRLSPHTIYAMTEAPAQAIRNHPRNNGHPLHVIDGLRYPRNGGDVVWGDAKVEHYHRTVSPSGFVPRWDNYTTEVINKTIYVKPDGIKGGKVGFPDIPGDKTIWPFDPIDTLFGITKVEHGEYRGPIIPEPVDDGDVGEHSVSLWKRHIMPNGYLAELMGTRKHKDNPYMWQGLRVGPLMPTIPDGTDMTVYGDAFVAMRVREIVAAGFDAFVCEYDLEQFDKRMRVFREQPAPVAARALSPASIQQESGPGIPSIMPAARFIRPDGNSDQYRKGAF